MNNNNLPVLFSTTNFYGIQLLNSEFRSWENIDESSSELIYHWDKININIHDQKQNIQIAVAKYLHTYDLSTIKNIAKAIRQTKELKETDRILGVAHQTIKKVGYVAQKKVSDNQQVSLIVNWVSEAPLGEMRQRLFNEDAELQSLQRQEVQLIENQFGNQMAVIYSKMPKISREFEDIYENIPRLESKINFNDSFADPQETKVDEGGTITVFYGTNRDRLEIDSNIQKYGIAETRELKVGTCQISIPRKHKQGQLERPWLIKQFFHWPESERRHFVIKATKETDEKSFISNFVEVLNEKPKKHALLFVHGYNTKFEEAAYRTAQLAWDLPFNGYTGFFSWPSAGTKSAYGNDDAAARSSAPLLKDFITKITAIPELEALHIIAHSMGGLILTLSLSLLVSDPANLAEMEKIWQLILGAPDIDKNEFFNVILPAFNKLGKQRTLYASDHDEALNLSASLRSLRNRLGQIGTGIFVNSGLDSINASNLKTASSHSYIFEGKELLSDLYHIVSNGLTPEQRRLREISYSPTNYWLFPE